MKPTASEWMSEVVQRPFGSGASAAFSLTIAAIALGIGCACLTHVPPGHYPRIVLMLPSLLSGGLAFFVLGPVFHSFAVRD